MRMLKHLRDKILARERERRKKVCMEKSIQERIKFVIYHIKGIVLDLGCVGGDYQWGLNTPLSPLHLKISQGPQFFTIGLDLNGPGLGMLKKTNPTLNLIYADAYNLPFKNQALDTIIASELTEHLDNVGEFLDEIYRALKKEGILVGDVPNAYRFSYIFSLLFFSLPPSLNTTHIHLFDEWNLNLLFLQHKFKAEIFYIPRIYTGKLKVFNYLEKLFPKTTDWLGFRARKISLDNNQLSPAPPYEDKETGRVMEMTVEKLGGARAHLEVIVE